MPISSSHTDLSWRDFGACTGLVELLPLFYHHRCNSKCKRKTRRSGAACERDTSVITAKAICSGCPALAHCRWWSIMTFQIDGISGGLTSTQRVTIRRNMRRTASGRELLASMKGQTDEQ